METELISFISNQGLAIAVSAFLIYWVTTQVSKTLEKIATTLVTHDERTMLSDQTVCDRVSTMCIKVDEIHAKVVRE